MLAHLIASAAAILPFAGSPAVDGATTFYASFDGERQPNYGYVAGEPSGNAEPIRSGRFGEALRFHDRSTVRFPLTEDTWNRSSGTIEFWLRPEWEPGRPGPDSIISVISNSSDRLYVNRDARGRFGAAVLGGPTEAPRWARTNLDGQPLQTGRWHQIAVIWDAGQLELWLDGARTGDPVAIPPMDEQPTELVIGMGEFSIDELRISDIRRYPGPVVDAGREPGPNRADRRYRTIEPANAYAFDFEAGDADRGFHVTTPHHSSEPARTIVNPSPASIEISSARGEREPAKLVVYARTDLGGVRVQLATPPPFPGLTLETRRVVRSPTRRFYRAEPGDADVVGRFLIAVDRIAIPEGEFRELWLTFDIPEDAPAGVHETHLDLSVAGFEPTLIPLRIEVHPFALPEPTSKRMGMYYKASRRLVEPERLRAELDDMLAHGVTDLIVDFRFHWVESGDDVHVLDGGFGRFVEMAAEAGFSHTIVVDTGFRQLARMFGRNEHAAMTAAAAKGASLLQAIAERFPGEIVVTHLDEVFNEGRLDEYIRYSKVAREAGYPRLYATFHTVDDGADAKRQRIAPFVDVRGHHGYTFEWWLGRDHTMSDYAAELEAAGDEAWLYHNVRGSYFPPSWGRIINGIYLRASPFVLNAPWIYQDYRGNPYDDSDSRRPDLGFAFPEPRGGDGIAPTLIYEQMREGLEDQLTLGLLEDLAGSNETAHREHLDWLESVDDLVRRAAATVEPTKSPTGADPALAGHSIDLDTGVRRRDRGVGTRREAPVIDAISKTLDGEALDEIRREAARRITAILESRSTSADD